MLLMFLAGGLLGIFWAQLESDGGEVMLLMFVMFMMFVLVSGLSLVIVLYLKIRK